MFISWCSTLIESNLSLCIVMVPYMMVQTQSRSKYTASCVAIYHEINLSVYIRP